MTVHAINMSDVIWRELLALREGNASPPPGSEGALYGPIAGASEQFVLAQVGQSLDGRVATPSGDARDISGPDGLAHLHRCRALVDAVIVGENTVSCDNPRLSVRLVEGPDPVRVVIDCHGRLTGSEGLFHDGGARVIVFQSAEADRSKLPNAEIIRFRPEGNGLAPQEMLAALRELGLSRVLVEGGARTIARFIDAGLIDRLHVAVSPIIIGSGPSGITLPPIQRLSSAIRPDAQVYSLGNDILFDCQLRATGR
jgi:diaminohydroxyphosphoribosylaminopyrimidine deaminase / 5-amino-6-(5-phosphoribosylamino)uracil reductase